MLTLLFTDIEGSSALWDADADAMRQALDDHNTVLSKAIEANGGRLVKDTGDGAMAVFESAAGAVQAAVAAQTVLQQYEPIRLRVRMGIHTASIQPVTGDYHGPDVNRVARIESAAHGGQVLLSEASSTLVADQLPPNASLIDLGEHRLRGLTRSERIFQLVTPGLESRFPPLRTPSQARFNLPTFSTPVAGRADEIAQVLDLIDLAPERRLVTLIGPGGVGKTRLAVATAEKWTTDRRRGAHFLPLAPVESAHDIIPALGDSLGFTVDRMVVDERDADAQVIDLIRESSMLLILDNMEHLPGGELIVSKLLKSAPGLRILATSRIPLDLSAEQLYAVKGLELPPDDPAMIETSPALQLFENRARAVDPSFELNAGDLPSVRRIVALVEGLPLGIELAASWITMLSCEEIADEIEGSLDFLSSSSSDIPERHRTMRAVFEGTWHLLGPEERRVLAELTVFPTAFTRDAATWVAKTDIRTLLGLVNKSLIRSPKPGELDLHPLILEYAAERSDSTESDLRERHARYYANRLLARNPDLRGGPAQLVARDALIAELKHVETAVEWGATHWSVPEIEELMGAMARFYRLHSWYAGWKEFAEIARMIDQPTETKEPHDLAYLWASLRAADFASSMAPIDESIAVATEQLETWTRVGGSGLLLCRTVLGVGGAVRGQYETAKGHLDVIYDLIDESDDPWAASFFHAWYGWALMHLGDEEGAASHYEEARRISESAGDSQGLAFVLLKLAWTAEIRGDLAGAIGFHLESLDTFSRIGDIPGQGFTLSGLSWLQYELADYPEARSNALAAVEKFDEIGHQWGLGFSWCRAGFAELELGNNGAAREAFHAALQIARDSGIETVGLYALTGFANLDANEGWLYEAALVLNSVKSNPATPRAERLCLPVLERLRKEMKSQAYADAEMRGEALTYDEALRLATRPIVPLAELK